MPWLLNALYLLLGCLLSPWLVYRAFRTGRPKGSSAQKFFGLIPASANLSKSGLHSSRSHGEAVIWMHGVSVGEVQLLKPLYDELLLRNPDATFAISTTTPTGMELAKKLFVDELVFYFPFDFTWSVTRVLNTIKPSILVLGELELWPNLIALSRKRDVPVCVVNGRLSERSFRGYYKHRWLTRSMFRKLSLVAAQDTTYADRFVACGVEQDRVYVTGSTKFDNVIFDRHHQHVDNLRRLVGLDSSKTVWIVGSTQAPEERAAVEAFKILRSEFPELRLVVVPRHQDRFESVFQELQCLGVDPLRMSTLHGNVATSDWQVCLVDAIGELRWWWGLADIALVGGSFGARGGQNMLEPAAYGANVAFGPNTSNFRDIAEILLKADGATRLSQLTEILPWTREQLKNPEPGRCRGRNSQAIIRKHQGALKRTAEALQTIIEQTAASPHEAGVQCLGERLSDRLGERSESIPSREI